MWVIASECESDGFRGFGGAVFDGQADVVVGFFEVEVRVAPGVEIAGPAEGLSGDGA